MPNTVPAAAEGLPKINRRKALTVTGSGLIAALAGLTASTMPTPAIAADAVSPALAALIGEFRAALDDANAKFAYAAALCDAPDCPMTPEWVPAPAAARELGFRKFHRSEHLREVAAKRIAAVKHTASVQTSPAFAEMLLRDVPRLEGYLAEGLAVLGRQEVAMAPIHKAEDACKPAADKTMECFRALISAPCNGLADIQAKTAAVMADDANWTEMDGDEARTMLRTFLPAGA